MTSVPRNSGTASTPNAPSRPALPNPTIYPDYCHLLSQTIGKWCPLRAKDVWALKDVGMFCDERILFHYGNHPIKWVRVTGVVVAVDEFKGKKVYVIDDGSGICVECTAVMKEEKKDLLGKRDGDQVGGKKDMPRHLREIERIKKGEGKNSDEVKSKEKEKGIPSVLDPLIEWDKVDVGTVVKVKGRVAARWEQIQVEVVKIEIVGNTDVEVRCWNEGLEFRRDILGKPWVVTPEEEEKCRNAREKELRRNKRGGREKEKEEERKKRKEREREKLEEEAAAKRRKKREDEERQRRKIRFPSLAVRKAAAGKYDALGI